MDLVDSEEDMVLDFFIGSDNDDADDLLDDYLVTQGFAKKAKYGGSSVGKKPNAA